MILSQQCVDFSKFKVYNISKGKQVRKKNRRDQKGGETE